MHQDMYPAVLFSRFLFIKVLLFITVMLIKEHFIICLTI